MMNKKKLKMNKKRKTKIKIKIKMITNFILWLLAGWLLQWVALHILKLGSTFERFF